MDNLSKEERIEKVSGELHIPAEVYAKILSASFETADKDVVELTAAVESGDYAAMSTIGHRVKGVFSNLRIMEVSEPAAKIDSLAKEQGDLEMIKQSLSELSSAYPTIKAMFL